MKYVTGLVVGKFCPLHYGHEYVIQTALDQCEKVIVLSYTSYEDVNHDHYSAQTRLKWLQSLPNQDRLDIHVLDPVDCPFPDDAASADAHRLFCASFILNKIESTVQAVFGSDDYITGFTNYLSLYFTANLISPMCVTPVIVDSNRTAFPISGTMLRNLDLKIPEEANEFDNSVSPVVAATFVKKILLLGAESTGKTTLVKMLQTYYDTTVVWEFGRHWYEKRNGYLVYEDMEFIGKTQTNRENSYTESIYLDRPLICDTSALTTAFYSQELFGRVSCKLSNLVHFNYDRIYLCVPDFPLVQDGTRQSEKFRQKGHEFYLKELGFNYPNYVLLEGALEQKFQTILDHLKT